MPRNSAADTASCQPAIGTYITIHAVAACSCMPSCQKARLGCHYTLQHVPALLGLSPTTKIDKRDEQQHADHLWIGGEIFMVLNK